MSNETAEYSYAKPGGVAISMGPDSDPVERIGKDLQEFNSDDLNKEKTQDVRAEREGVPEDGVGAERGAEEGAAGGDEEAGELGAFEPESPEAVAAWDAKYTLEDGTLDMEGSLTQAFWDRKAAGEEGLSEDHYAYLASKGISKATVKQVEAMAATQKDVEAKSIDAHDGKLFEIAGGPDVLAKALAWGKAGGYDAAAQERFNTITKGKDLQAKQDAVEALMARYNKANPAEKPRLPKRDATKGQGATAQGVKPYASRQEMKTVRDAIREGDTAAWNLHNRRRAVSKFD